MNTQNKISNQHSNHNDREKNEKDTASHDLSLHSEEIKENLDNINMDAWYYIYQNYVNTELKKKAVKE